ncbi:triacylglycerol lipase 1 [Cornus florida]|uniref:triacylglycerol lipase 1 n=1 Tax=Cornus florida TaxID=4283 RepID=UPI00289B3491|nr:triacylglycerol lipase 1 [Cornus florida]
MERLVVATTAVAHFFCIFLIFSVAKADGDFTGELNIHRRSPVNGLCAQLIAPSGYPCEEHTIQTKDGYLLGLQRVSSSGESFEGQRGFPVLLQHGLFMSGDAWFLDSIDQSLGFILADRGFDVWVGNVRGTRWSHGHTSLSEKDKEFWDWSWEELALYDLAEMIHFVNLVTNSKIFVVGHSQGTIMSLAAFTQPDIVKMVEAAALLCPISYLEHISAPFVHRIVNMHLDRVILAMGIHQLNFKSDVGAYILDSICDGHVDCNDLLTSITGENCCFNNSRVDFYLEYEPHPSSSKNLNHLFQMIRKGTFAKYDYGIWKNLKQYGQLKPPEFDLSRIPESLPLWMAYGGNDALADVMDVQHTLKDLQSKPELLYLEKYGHIDFLLSVNAKEDVFDSMIAFFKSWRRSSSI